MIQNSQQNSALSKYQIDPLGLLRRKFWLIGFFILLCTALSYLYYLKAPKTYESTAKIYVIDRNAPTLSQDPLLAESTVDKYLEIIRSRNIIERALEGMTYKEGIDSIENIESLIDVEESSITDAVSEALVAKSADRSKLSGVMEISYQCNTQDDCDVMLSNVLASFDEFIQSGSRTTGEDKKDSIKDIEQRNLKRELEIQKEIEGLITRPNIQVVDGKAINQYDMQVSKLQSELDDKVAQRLGYKALLENLDTAKATGNNVEELIVETLQDINDGQLNGYVANHQTFLELKVREQELMGDFGNAHPELINVRNQIEMVDRLQKQQLLSAFRSGSDAANTGTADFFSTVRAHIVNRIELLVSHESKLSEAISGAKQDSLVITKECDRLTMLMRQREMMDEKRFEISDTLSNYEAATNFVYREVDILSSPSEPEQVAPDLLISLAAGFFLGGIFGIGFSILKELAEKTFRSSDEVATQLGVPVVSQIGVFNSRIPRETNFKSVNGDVISLHRPQSLPAEAYKALRTSVFFNSQQTDAKVIQVTSPSPGDGKSTVSANLAVVMSQAGRKVLLIDCDFRKPSQHTRFGLNNKVGMSSVLTGEATIEDAIDVIGLPNLHILTSGPQFANPAELLTTRVMEAVLQEARDKYDFVIVDTPPVLPVTDPVIISNYVDAVYLPMRIRNGVQINAQRAIEALASVGSEVKGVVVNGLKKRDSGYNYGYGYGYGNRQYGTYGNFTGKPLEVRHGSEDESELTKSAH